jgi:hypothetical protein
MKYRHRESCRKGWHECEETLQSHLDLPIPTRDEEIEQTRVKLVNKLQDPVQMLSFQKS